MELIFVRHGQGQHTMDVPESLQLEDASLTETGKRQALALRNVLPLNPTDLLVISPLRRTLQTALIWSDAVSCEKIVSPLVSPRMFPLLTEDKKLPCDKILHMVTIMSDFPRFQIQNDLPDYLWIEGINCISDEEFNKLADQFVSWCKATRRERVIIVSHDGTITSYREFFTGEKLSRKDFLGETGVYRITLQK